MRADKKEDKTNLRFESFDQEYFDQIDGSWIALGQENCTNQKYFTVVDEAGEKLGIVGVYNTAEDKNITHTIVDPGHRGKGLATKFKLQMADALNLDAMTLTIDLNNDASLNSARKMPDTKRVSDELYEKEFHKVKFVWQRPKKTNKNRRQFLVSESSLAFWLYLNLG